MGKGGRFACILTPYALTIGALVCLVLVGLGCTKPDGTLSSIYFAKVDASEFDPDSIGKDSSLRPIAHGLDQADAKGDLHDYYLVGLWNYCYGEEVNGKMGNLKCTERKTKFWFNPIDVWNLDNEADDVLPGKLKDGLKVYKSAAAWLFIAYAVAVAATALQLLVGISAIFSRWGSFATTLISCVSTLFFIGAAGTATAIYATLVGAVKVSLKPFDIKASMGTRMLSIMWIGVVFSLASGLFWLFSVCCCSGRSPYSHGEGKGKRRGVTAEKTPYTYERVTTPYGGAPQHPSSVPLTSMAPNRETAYEPYRQV
ncbi:hypothetical protein FQN57_005318 [Myotisia sp. PD_48]|nr:hypothetical protein FQN57_005318 [Myotisia sp. PD_48]